MAIGLAIPFPAISGADPWTGSNNAPSLPIFADGINPSPPTRPAPSSDNMSPNRFVVTMTSKLWGCVIRYIAVAST